MEEQLLKKRLLELAKVCYNRDIAVHSNFLTLQEQELFLRLQREMAPAKALLWGGYENAERRAVFFLPSYGDEEEEKMLSPVWLCISPKAERFAEELTHRDYLGSLMALGLERDRTGDILISGKRAYIAVFSDVADFICNELTSVRHTSVICECAALPEELAEPKIEERTGSVSSERVDAVIALAFRLSRGAALDAIKAGYVFVNGRQIFSASQLLKENDILSVRHKGKLRYDGIDGKSKKGRLIVKLSIYV